jgi:chromosome segregation protein
MPFYMIDEMDAHLDPANTEKLADLLKARSKNSQFVLISLKDVTIARGDKVHGIFVQDGASRLITLPLQQLP